MFGFEEHSASLATLTAEQREKLIELLMLRNELSAHQLKLNALQIDLLRNPTEAGQTMLTDYAELHVAPLRRRIAHLLPELVDEAVEQEKIAETFPLLLAAVMQHVNIPFLLTVLGLDPDSVKSLGTAVSDYLRKGMSD